MRVHDQRRFRIGLLRLDQEPGERRPGNLEASVDRANRAPGKNGALPGPHGTAAAHDRRVRASWANTTVAERILEGVPFARDHDKWHRSAVNACFTAPGFERIPGDGCRRGRASCCQQRNDQTAESV